MLCPQCSRPLKEGASLCRGCGLVVDPALLDAAPRSIDRTRSGFTQTRLPAPPATSAVDAGFIDVPITDVAGDAPPQSSDEVTEALHVGMDERGMDSDDKTVASAPHDEVARYLEKLQSNPSAPPTSAEDLEDLMDARTERLPSPFLRATVPMHSEADADAATVIREVIPPRLPPPKPIGTSPGVSGVYRSRKRTGP